MAAALAACTERDTVVLGASIPVTGLFAKAGLSYRDAYQIAVDRINESGGISVGGARRQLALTLLDNESDSKLALQQHEELASGQADFLLGSYTGFDVLAGSSVAETRRIPMVQAGASTSRMSKRGNKYVFGMLPAGENIFRSTIDMLQRLTPKPRTVGLIVGDGPTGIDIANGTKARLSEAGLELVLLQQYSGRTPNFYNILTLVETRAPDVLLWSGLEAQAGGFLREARSRDISPKLLFSLSTVGSSASFLTTLGKDADYLFGMTPWLPDARLKDRWFGDAEQFANLFKEKFAYPPDYHAAAAVAAVETLAVAIEKVGSMDASRVRDAIAQIDFESLYGRVHFAENGQIDMPQKVIQIQNGQVVEVFTDRFVNEPLYPTPAWSSRP
jgi:branched-chain amino acid transport system substrate-binding protein